MCMHELKIVFCFSKSINFQWSEMSIIVGQRRIVPMNGDFYDRLVEHIVKIN